MHPSSTQHHGVVTGAFLAIGLITFGFLMQSDPIRLLHSGSLGLLAVVVALVAIVLFFQLKGDPRK